MVQPLNNNGKLLTRRSLMAILGTTGVASFLPVEKSGATTGLINQRKIPFGAALQYDFFLEDSDYAALLGRNCDIIFPMNMLKMDSLRHSPGVFDVERAELLVDFAEKLNRKTHGHALFWYAAVPKWLKKLDDTQQIRTFFTKHIEETLDHFRGRIPSWDVVNEVVAHDPLEEGDWRGGFWHETLGPKHIVEAFEIAHKTAPETKLWINDYDMAYKGPRYDKRREIYLNLVRELQDKNIPIEGIGFQGHLYPENVIDRKETASFINALKALGVSYSVSELDVIDWKLPINNNQRDLEAAKAVDVYLDALFSAAPPVSISTWGLSDRYSWISDVMPHRMGAKNRPLPYDENLRKKPMMSVIEKYLQA